MKTEIITIGDELLIGQTADTNGQWMARQLTALGLEVQRITTVSDQTAAIVSVMEQALDRSAMIFVTGGLGPTRDDVTGQAITRFFNVRWKEDEQVYRRMQQYLAERGYRMSDINAQQAQIPEGSRIYINQVGTAPGIELDKGGVRFFFMPGVPAEMRQMMRQAILPAVQGIGLEDFYEQQILVTQGIPEAHLAERLKSLEQQLPARMQLAYLPSGGLVKLRLSGRSGDAGELRQTLDAHFSRLKDVAGRYVVYTGDQPPEEMLGQMLAANHQWVSTAESCTGGEIAGRITSVPGSSRYFAGSLVAYSNSIKQRILGVSSDLLSDHGAVSQPVVEAMASKALELFQTDYAIAVSGIAGPSGGTPQKKVGTTWIAVAGRDHTTSRLYHFGSQRDLNVHKAANTALVMLIRMIGNEI